MHLVAKCSVSCFQHPFIRDLFHSETRAVGRCDYCGAAPRRLIPVGELADHFHNLIAMYEESEDGSSLISLVQDQWYVFSDKLHIAGNSRELLQDILNSHWDDDSGEAPISA